MMRRIPLWLTVVPLILAVGGYWWVWSGYRDTFRAELARILPGKPVGIGGFPYRLEATVDAPELVSRAPDIAARAAAASAVLNRGPWQPDLTIVRGVSPVISAAIPALAASGLTIRGASAETSVHLDQAGDIARLSTVFTKASVDLVLLGAPLTARSLEVHVREIPGRTDEAWSPSLPQRAQLVLAGTDVRIAAGAPLSLVADLRITGPERLIDYARWAPEGTVEVRGLTLGDATGEVLRLDATLVASGGRPRLTGTIVTPCPQSIRAALVGTPRVGEQRLRVPVRLALGGTPGAWTLVGLPVAPRAVRAQLPACPALR